MPSITSLVKLLSDDLPSISFKPGDTFHWSSSQQTVFYPNSSNDRATLLHEVGHAILGHTDYIKDIELIAMERDAWHYATTQLAVTYNIIILEETVEESLDTYRDWLHARSTCPECGATGLQVKKVTYSCIVCTTTWEVNEARSCGLKRYTIKK